MKTSLAHHSKSHRSWGAANEQSGQAGSIAHSLVELRRAAKQAGLETLTGLLEIAYYEAFTKANRTEAPEEARKWIADMEKLASRL